MNGLQEITKLAEQLTPAEQLELVEHLAHRLRSNTRANSKPKNLYGAWKNKFPDDIDIVSDLREIRDGWKQKLDAE
ncbi:MAG: hypothetical protein KF762_03065 [Acidobacteria bacterium]|mgnify:CR=1 FL=1|nr:hypothetical protein [Acidobacteriota bacterium]